jgi:hypothetical protein
MLKKILAQIKDLDIMISYARIDNNGHFGVFNDVPIVFINETLNELDTALTLLHEIAHFLNGDRGHVPNRFVNADIEFKANHYMIYETMKFLDQKYDFEPNTNCQRIINDLDLPYHLDGVIYDAFFSIIQDKFDIDKTNIQEDYWWCN